MLFCLLDLMVRNVADWCVRHVRHAFDGALGLTFIISFFMKFFFHEPKKMYEGD